MNRWSGHEPAPRLGTLSDLMQRLSFIVFAVFMNAVLAQQASTVSPPPPGALISINLEEAIARARANEPNFAAAAANSKVTSLNRSIARAALLPSAIAHNQMLYTQGGGPTTSTGTVASPSAPRFIANNTIHEYTSQASIVETLGMQQVTAVARAYAADAVAKAEFEIARRGLVTAVTAFFYQALAADHKVAVARRAAGEAASFTHLAQQRENVREGAHADVVKAQLQQQQRDRDLADAILIAQKSHLDLGVLLLPDPRTPYLLSPGPLLPLPTRGEVDASAMRLNPELHQALASLRVSTVDVTAARAAYLPDLVLNFNYGIDAGQFAVNGRDGVRNLGYSASATVDIPVWDWLSTQHRVRQSEILRDVAHTVLTATQRQLIAQLDESYAEASTSRDQLQSLDESVKTAAESLRLTRLRYTAGEATVLEVVDAQNSLTIAEIAREDGNIRYQMALTNLQLLTGAI